MKYFFALIFAATILQAQSDCGNCYPVPNSGCFPSQEAICNPQCCQVCEFFMACDDPSCNYHIGPICDCLPGCGGLSGLPCKTSKSYKTASLRRYGPVSFHSKLQTPIVIDTTIKQVTIKSRFWWKKGESNVRLALGSIY